jgi:hypothetical protein
MRSNFSLSSFVPAILLGILLVGFIGWANYYKHSVCTAKISYPVPGPADDVQEGERPLPAPTIRRYHAGVGS